MTKYVIGDIHGCYKELLLLLEKIQFNRSIDELISVGDIFDKGPDEAAVCNLLISYNASLVLGNHDVKWLLNRNRDLSNNLNQKYSKSEIASWLSNKSLILNFGDDYIVHAGINPSWTLEEAYHLSNHFEKYKDELFHIHNELGNFSKSNLEGNSNLEKCYTIFNNLCLIRKCDLNGDITNTSSDLPWFMHWENKLNQERIIFGHYAVMRGVNLNKKEKGICIGLDTGCVYGEQMTALSLEEGTIYQVQSLFQYFNM
jgi:bis(5'-nucleosyl)-tetraphosphatase (symmetrical)